MPGHNSNRDPQSTLPPVDYLPVPTFLADFNTKSGEYYPALVAGKELNTINPSQAPLDVTETGGSRKAVLDLTAVSACSGPFLIIQMTRFDPYLRKSVPLWSVVDQT